MIAIVDRRCAYRARHADYIDTLPAREQDNAWADHYARIRRGELVQATASRGMIKAANVTQIRSKRA